MADNTIVWKNHPDPCPKCNTHEVKYYIWESSCGGYEDVKYNCTNCHYTWWVDGIDS